ncbi:MAG: glycosyltransferase family 2 protein [Peptoniphilaceae bacterium]|nr:glycosyltransferase family 2 protein [Peptoniphilaceae bacterium]
MEEKISVIVPIYNVEKYLKKSVESIINQTYKNLEIILVNDGSTDRSLEISKEYEKKDMRIKVYEKINGGLSDARNFGFNKSSGDYIIFIDSDDYIETDMIKSLYTNMKKEDADVSVCGVYNVYSNKKTPQCEDKNIYFVCNKIKFLKEYFIGKLIPGTICNKLIKREIASSISFPVGKIYEDAFYHYDLIKYAKKYVITTKPYYNYFHRENSITTKPYSKKNMDCIEIYKKFYDYILQNEKTLTNEAFFRLSYAHFTVLDKMLVSKDYKKIDEYKNVISFLKNNYIDIFRNKNFRITRRVSAIALKINVKLYRYLLIKDNSKNKGVN